MVDWLKDTVFYEIYPQSFYDTNEDGIGDIEGIIQKLDYIKELGCNALWINPFYDSPFMDAGYDVRDYKKVAKRYGTNEDAKRLFKEAHKRGIKVLLDLVAGHTSDEHEWFKASKKAQKNEYSDRYVWTNGAFTTIKDKPYISGMSDRDGVYMLNFFASQPALNYGWLNRTEKWMSEVDSKEAIATRNAIKDVICFWLEMGADGFRCDMADYLVKNDDKNKSATALVWADIRESIKNTYPNVAFVSEWCNPKQAINGAKFEMDFYLNHTGNGYNTLARDYENGEDNSFFLKKGNGCIYRFLDDYLPKYYGTRENGYISMFTCNHDTKRASFTLSTEELKLFYAFILTMPGVPFIYYGDEIGMNYNPNLTSKEGGYARTGSRTPMQWNEDKNKGFSKAKKEMLYLPVDETENSTSVKKQLNDKDSLLNTTKSLIKLRHENEDLQADSEFKLIYAVKGKRLFIYKRGKLIIAINPESNSYDISIDELKGYEVIYSIGKCSLEGVKLNMGECSLLVCKPVN
jgi:alpha-amylase amy13G